MGIRTLAIEDDPTIADSLVPSLREEGFTVEHGWVAGVRVPPLFLRICAARLSSSLELVVYN